MPTLTIRNLPEDVHTKLRVRAAQHGRSTEAEVRAVLAQAVSDNAVAEITPEERARFDAALDAAQAALAPYRNPERLLSDELIAERRLEAWRETVEGFYEARELQRYRAD